MTFARILELDGGIEDDDRIREAARALREGRIVVFPTETVYGVGCHGGMQGAVRRLCEIKRRPAHKPLAFYVDSGEGAVRYVERLSPLAERAMDAFWPGPLTLIVAPPGKKEGVGFRCPDDDAARALIREAGVPLVGTSANRSGGPPPIDGAGAVESMGGLADVILKGGRTLYAAESTILDLCSSAPRVLREGIISTREIEEKLAIKIN